MSFITVMLNSSIKNGLLLESLLIQSAMLINQRKKNDSQRTFEKI